MGEPHTGKIVQIGTWEVRTYRPPAYLFDKILYIEKSTLAPTLKAAKIAERYDMAIIYGQGYANTAARDLARELQEGKEYDVFVLHDTDIPGYNIARTLAEETVRMPNHRINVIDLGLTVAQAVDLKLTPEKFTRNSAIPQILLKMLDERKLEWCTGVQIHGRPVDFQQKKVWLGDRVELNKLIPRTRSPSSNGG